MDTSLGATRATAHPGAVVPDGSLSIRRRNLMRAGYLLMAVGLAVTPWDVVWRQLVRAPGEGWR